MKKAIASIIAIALAIPCAFAQFNAADRPDVTGLPLGDARAFGLEGAMTAVNDDMNTLFFNPAGLAFLKRNYLNVNVAYGNSEYTNSLRIYTEYIPVDKAHMSAYSSNALQPNLVIGGKGWGLALTSDYAYYMPFIDEKMAADFEQTTYVSRRIGAVGGFGLNLGPLAVGANLKYYTYSDYGVAYPVREGLESIIGKVLVGNGIDIAGVTYQMDVGLGALVTLGTLNVGAYYGNMMPFLTKVINKEPYNLDAYLGDCFKTMSVGASFMPSNDKFSKGKLPVDLVASLDLKNLGDNDKRELCAGAEFGFDVFNILVATARVGYKQALPTSSFSAEEMIAAFTPENAEVSVGATAKVAMAKADVSILVPLDMLASDLSGSSSQNWDWVKVNVTAGLCF
jgi:hypothetical protein